MSTQRTYQIRHQSLGLCVICPRKAVNSTLCERHRTAVRERAAAARKKKNPALKQRRCQGCLKLGHNVRTCDAALAARDKAADIFAEKAREGLQQALDAAGAELSQARRVRDDCRASHDKAMAMLKEAQTERDAAQKEVERLRSMPLSSALSLWLYEETLP